MEIENQNAEQEEFEYLVDTRHIDNEDVLEYVVTRVGKLRVMRSQLVYMWWT